MVGATEEAVMELENAEDVANELAEGAENSLKALDVPVDRSLINSKMSSLLPETECDGMCRLFFVFFGKICFLCRSGSMA